MIDDTSIMFTHSLSSIGGGSIGGGSNHPTAHHHSHSRQSAAAAAAAHHHHHHPSKAAAAAAPRRSARRCLFGRPDPKRSDSWLSDRLEEMHKAQQQRWGFDFHTERPCASAASDYAFEIVSDQSVPNFYRASYYAGGNESCHSSDSENQSPCDGGGGGGDGGLGLGLGVGVGLIGGIGGVGVGGLGGGGGGGGGGGDEVVLVDTSDSDCSMESLSPLFSPLKFHRYGPLKQTKLTAYMKVQSSRKRLQHGVKTSDLASPSAAITGGGGGGGSSTSGSSSSSSPSSSSMGRRRRFKTTSLH